MAVAQIAGAGGLEFAGDPEVLAAFTALKPAARKKKAAADLEPVTLAEPLGKTG